MNKKILLFVLIVILFYPSESFCGKDFPVSKIKRKKSGSDRVYSSITDSFYTELKSVKSLKKLNESGVKEEEILSLNFHRDFSKLNGYLLKSLKLYCEGYYKTSLIYSGNIRKINKKSGISYLVSSLNNFQLGRYRRSLKDSETAIKKFRFSPEIKKTAAISALNMKEYSKARKYASYLKKYDKDSMKRILSQLPEKKKVSKKKVRTVSQNKKIRFKEMKKVNKSLKTKNVRVGISTRKGRTIPRKKIEFQCSGKFKIKEIKSGKTYYLKGDHEYTGKFHDDLLIVDNKKIRFPVEIDYGTSSVIIRDILFGAGYPWERYETRQYRGKIILEKSSTGFTIVNEINLEEYIAGVIPAEMPSYYPLEALKAQAVAARSEAMKKIKYHRHKKYGYELCDDVCCQAYRGVKLENKRTIKAVNETTGLVLTGEKGIVDAVYSSCCGGITQSSHHLKGWGKTDNLISVNDSPHKKKNKFSFLEDGKDEYCSVSPNQHRWIRVFEKDLFLKNLKKINSMDSVRTIEPLKRNVSGHLRKIRISGNNKKTDIERELKIRNRICSGMLRSSKFLLVEINGRKHDLIVIIGAGFGHGAGLCQEGAWGMAEKGKNFKEILEHYYKNIRIKSF